MTRIGTVKLKSGGKYYAPTVLQYVREDGKRKLAKFEFVRNLFNFERSLLAGDIIRLTHHEYRRAQ